MSGITGGGTIGADSGETWTAILGIGRRTLGIRPQISDGDAIEFLDSSDVADVSLRRTETGGLITGNAAGGAGHHQANFFQMVSADGLQEGLQIKFGNASLINVLDASGGAGGAEFRVFSTITVDNFIQLIGRPNFGIDLASSLSIDWSATDVFSGAKDVGFKRDQAGRIRVTDGATSYGAIVAGTFRIRDTVADTEATITLTGSIRFSAGLRAPVYNSVSLGTAGGPAFASGAGNLNGGLFFTLDGADVIPRMSGKGVEAQRWEDIVSTFSVDVDMGTNDITNVGLVDGVDVSTHAARHQSGGADQVDHDLLFGFDIAEHRIINDAGNSTIELLSSNKILSITGSTGVFGQFSDSTSQKPSTTNPTVITFNTDNENEGITHARPEDIKPGSGIFTFFFQPQVERTGGGPSLDFHAWARKGRRDGPITAVSVANPSVITAIDHRIQTGQTVTLSGLTTTPDINGAHVVTVTGPDTFTIPVNVTAVTDGVGDWTRQLDIADDAPNTNIELTLSAANQSDVIPLGMSVRMQADDVMQFIQSVTDTGEGAGLVALTPAGEPAIPSAILTVHRVGS